ncbi:hypothetical protein LG634_03685 [Streptomyces bambusae]|uniref:hypothetical protein n=1 Tax=Streptomyces bambusae TaxID=1550616 RepID=UPI001CFE8F2B|nr:hypothetical protein [Streptomyces bambusae]MCB5163938.1 hypothetical protein [Streptomyces bambusae]
MGHPGHRSTRGHAPGSRLLPGAAILCGALVLAGCAPGHRPDGAARDDLIKAATLRLTDECLAARDLTPPEPGRKLPPGQERRVTAALFGTGPAELSLTLPTGYTVRAHTDGCLARAQQQLYGDQAAWFEASVTVNNLRPLTEQRLGEDPAYAAALARGRACAEGDAGCIRASGLPQVRARREGVLAAEVRAAHGEQIAAHERLRARAAQRATAVLAAVRTSTTAADRAKGT